MTPQDFLRDVVDPGAAFLSRIAGIQSDQRARLLLLAIAGQETEWVHRLQFGGGPGRSYWQFERGGGLHGVLTHHASKDAAAKVLAALQIPAADERVVFEAIAWNDLMAFSFARLLIWTDAYTLPAVGNADGAWMLYAQRLWRPGRPRPEKWQRVYQEAMEAVGA